MAKRPLEIRYKGKKLRVGEIGDAIASLPKNIRGPALEVVTRFYLVKFRKYPRYKRVRRARAYPEVNGFFSDKQRRFVMAGIADGSITPGTSQRTGALKNGWRIEGRLSPLTIVNSAPGAVFAYHPIYQARQLDLVGWKDIGEMTDENSEGAFNALDKWMDKNLYYEIDKVILKK